MYTIRITINGLKKWVHIKWLINTEINELYLQSNIITEILNIDELNDVILNKPTKHQIFFYTALT